MKDAKLDVIVKAIDLMQYARQEKRSFASNAA